MSVSFFWQSGCLRQQFLAEVLPSLLLSRTLIGQSSSYSHDVVRGLQYTEYCHLFSPVEDDSYNLFKCNNAEKPVQLAVCQQVIKLHRVRLPDDKKKCLFE